MALIISAKTFKLTPTLKNYVTIRLKRVLKFYPLVQELKAELDHDHNQRSGLVFRAELSARIGSRTLKAGQKAEHMEEAIDLCMPKLVRQVEKLHQKQLRSRQPGAKTIRQI